MTQDHTNDLRHTWIWEDDGDGGEERCGGTWKRPGEALSWTGVGRIDSDGPSTRAAIAESEGITSAVRNWCDAFVLALDLCPWARASLQTEGAMRFFLVPPFRSGQGGNERWLPEQGERERNGSIVDAVAKRFQDEILKDAALAEDDESDARLGAPSTSSVLERAAIYFVVFLSNNNNGDNSFPQQPPSDSFVEYIDWFTDLEDNWPEDFDDVIVAPFHPSWEFASEAAEEYSVGTDAEACLDYEKRSPFPLVTLVSTRVVESAGETVTEAIGEHNKKILLAIETEHRERLADSSSSSSGNNEPTSQKKGCPAGRGAASSVAELWRSAVSYGRTDEEDKSCPKP